MSNIPQDRDHLLDLIHKNFDKLWQLITELNDQQGDISIDDDFSIKDLIVIRVWWVSAVQRWVADGQRGKTFPLPAADYNWQQTPALNRETVKKAESTSLTTARQQLRRANTKLLKLIDSLDDAQLTQAGQYEWAGKWPLMRWISIGSSSQYDGARKQIRKALKRENLL